MPNQNVSNRQIMMAERGAGAEKTAVSQFDGQKYLAIESYRKDGKAVSTPVWFIEEKGTLFVRTDYDTGKVKRIRRNPNIRIAICSMRGEPKGAWIDAKAKFASEEEAERAYQLLKQKYGLQYRLIRFIDRIQGRKSKAVCLAIKA